MTTIVTMKTNETVVASGNCFPLLAVVVVEEDGDVASVVVGVGNCASSSSGDIDVQPTATNAAMASIRSRGKGTRRTVAAVAVLSGERHASYRSSSGLSRCHMVATFAPPIIPK